MVFCIIVDDMAGIDGNEDMAIIVSLFMILLVLMVSKICLSESHFDDMAGIDDMEDMLIIGNFKDLPGLVLNIQYRSIIGNFDFIPGINSNEDALW